MTKNKGLAELIILGIIAGAIIAGIAAVVITKKPDSAVEQIAEQVIKAETGKDVDFSAELKKKEQEAIRKAGD